MQIFRLRSLSDYVQHVERNKLNYDHMRNIEGQYASIKRKEFTVPGISYPAGKLVDFAVDYQFSDGVHINWRERIICPITGLNNRLRSSVHLIDCELAPYPDSSIYITEQVTPLFTLLEKQYKNLQGSEFLGVDLPPGIVKNNIRHEDMTNLSFKDGQFDFYLSFECFEHIPFYQKAIPEIYRVLSEKGVFFGTFPFDRNSHGNLVRAKIGNGEIVHILEPEYHGDPVGNGGILCYTVFGWEMFDEFRQAGFKDVYAILVWSDVFGYLGGEQIFIVAKK